MAISLLPSCTTVLLLCTLTPLITHNLYSGVRAADEDPLQDFCVADVDNNNMQNGLPCKPASDVESADFASPLLREPRNRNQALGVAFNLATAAAFPGLNTQGLSMSRIDFQPRGLQPPHTHPRAAELLFLVQGTLKVGFVSTASTLFQQTLRQGDLFVFPRGLSHFLFNPDLQEPALAISAFNSQNPGVSQLASALFASQPLLPDDVLQTALGTDDQREIELLIASVARTL